jgi:hypothetical protein
MSQSQASIVDRQHYETETEGGRMFRAASWVILVVVALVGVAANASAQSSTASTTETKSFQVITVDGNLLVVRLPEGTREIAVPEGFMFTVDGKQLSVRELKPGMRGTATITTKTTVTPVTVTEVKNGTVVQSSGANVIIRTDEGLRSFGPGELDKRGVKIMRDGRPATIADLRQGDRLTATIVTSMPPRVVTEKEVMATTAKPGAPAATAGASASGAPPTAQSASAGQSTASPARTLPSTASPLPLLGVAGLGSLVAAIVARRRRLSR